MKTRVEHVTQSYEYTVYGCDHCSFESEDQEDLDKHVGREHAVLERKKVGDHDFIRFGDQLQFNSYLRANGVESGIEHLPGNGWQGPGWYAEVYESTRGNCRCGGCVREYVYLWSAAHMREQALNDIARVREDAESKIKKLSDFAFSLGSMVKIPDEAKPQT